MSAIVSTALPLAATFKDQVSQSSFLFDVFYALATVCLLFIVGAVALIDAGLVRRKNVLDTWIQKIVCALIGAGAMAIVGYAIWQIQFYQALAIPHPVSQCITSMRSSIPMELASPVVPRMAKPLQPLASSQWPCAAMRSMSIE